MDIGIPEILLIAAGLISFLLVHLYRKDKDSGSYKATMVLGLLVGAILIILTAANLSKWPTLDSLLIIVAGFALVIRPFRNTDFAIIVAVLSMAIAYVWLGKQTGDLSVLAEPTVRIIITIVIGAVIYMILNFLQRLAQLIGKLLNFWPILFLLGCICLIEGALIIAGGNTLFDYIEHWRSSSSSIIAMIGL